MADHTGIQAVSVTLRRLLETGMEGSAPPRILISTPDATPPTGPWVNLFLYRISPNPEFRPDRDEESGEGRNPHGSLPIDLHYLITAAGDEPSDASSGEALLGNVMLVLHRHAVIPQDHPARSAVLRDDGEPIRIVQEPLGPRTLARLWAATPAPIRLSLSYVVTGLRLRAGTPG